MAQLESQEPIIPSWASEDVIAWIISQCKIEWVHSTFRRLREEWKGDYDELPPEFQLQFFLQRVLLSDIKFFGVGCLPHLASLQELPQGRYLLQIEDAQDQHACSSERHVSDHAHNRLLKIALYDGHSQAVAVEHESLRVLSTNVPYGCKLMVVGPVKLLRGMLLLRPSNVHVLGGRVSERDIQRVLLKEYNTMEPTGTPKPPFIDWLAERNAALHANAMDAAPSHNAVVDPSQGSVAAAAGLQRAPMQPPSPLPGPAVAGTVCRGATQHTTVQHPQGQLPPPPPLMPAQQQQQQHQGLHRQQRPLEGQQGAHRYQQTDQGQAMAGSSMGGHSISFESAKCPNVSTQLPQQPTQQGPLASGMGGGTIRAQIMPNDHADGGGGVSGGSFAFQPSSIQSAPQTRETTANFPKSPTAITVADLLVSGNATERSYVERAVDDGMQEAVEEIDLVGVDDDGVEEHAIDREADEGNDVEGDFWLAEDRAQSFIYDDDLYEENAAGNEEEADVEAQEVHGNGHVVGNGADGNDRRVQSPAGTAHAASPRRPRVENRTDAAWTAPTTHAIEEEEEDDGIENSMEEECAVGGHDIASPRGQAPLAHSYGTSASVSPWRRKVKRSRSTADEASPGTNGRERVSTAAQHGSAGTKAVALVEPAARADRAVRQQHKMEEGDGEENGCQGHVQGGDVAVTEGKRSRRSDVFPPRTVQKNLSKVFSGASTSPQQQQQKQQQISQQVVERQSETVDDLNLLESPPSLKELRRLAVVDVGGVANAMVGQPIAAGALLENFSPHKHRGHAAIANPGLVAGNAAVIGREGRTAAAAAAAPAPARSPTALAGPSVHMPAPPAVDLAGVGTLPHGQINPNFNVSFEDSSQEDQNADHVNLRQELVLSLSSEPFTYLWLLLERVKRAASEAFPLHACIQGSFFTLVGRPDWRPIETDTGIRTELILRAIVEDGAASSLMQLDQVCLLALINGHMTAYQATSMDELYATKSLDKRHPHRLSVKKALQAVATLLETFYGLIEVRVDEAGAEPRIVQLLGDTLSESQMEQLRNRVNL